jgi:hypothetical protein
MRRWLLGLGAALAVLAATAAPVAAEGPSDLDGEPSITEDHRTPFGYYLWHSDRGMHLRTHGTSEGQTYTAYLRTDGAFVDVETVRLEAGDRVAVVNGGHGLVLQFHTWEGIDGINFRVRDGEAIGFTLKVDGELIRTSHIFLGRAGRHPAANPFTLRP